MSHYNLPINLQLINGIQPFPIVIFAGVGIPTFLSGPRSYVWKVVLRNAEWSPGHVTVAGPAVRLLSSELRVTNKPTALRF